MICFTIVELLYATPEDYTRLDALMNVSGFKRETRSKKGKIYRLPRGTYYCQSSRSIREVLNIARSIAASTGFAHEVMTIPAAGAHWFPNASGAAGESDEVAEVSLVSE